MCAAAEKGTLAIRHWRNIELEGAHPSIIYTCPRWWKWIKTLSTENSKRDFCVPAYKFFRLIAVFTQCANPPPPPFRLFVTKYRKYVKAFSQLLNVVRQYT